MKKFILLLTLFFFAFMAHGQEQIKIKIASENVPTGDLLDTPKGDVPWLNITKAEGPTFKVWASDYKTQKGKPLNIYIQILDEGQGVLLITGAALLNDRSQVLTFTLPTPPPTNQDNKRYVAKVFAPGYLGVLKFFSWL